MKLLRSFEEFIFEAVTWLVLYPISLWRIFTQPLTTMAYSDAEQLLDEKGRYAEILSPPLMLLVTVFALNGIVGLMLPETIHGQNRLTREIFSSPQYMALFRAIMFSLLPLVGAVILLRRTKVKLTRDTIRTPFYAQCYLAIPCAIITSLGLAIFKRHDIPDLIGVALLVGGGAWFLVTQTRWFRSRLNVSWLNAALTALSASVQSVIYVLALVIPIALV